MADKAARDDRLEEQTSGQTEGDSEDDTEGHLMMPDIAAARALAHDRTSSAERNARFRIRHKEERPGDKRGR